MVSQPRTSCTTSAGSLENECVPRGNLGPATPERQLVERIFERQPNLSGVPAPSQLFGHAATAIDLDAETVEAQRARPVRDARLGAFGSEAVARFLGPAAGAQRCVALAPIDPDSHRTTARWPPKALQRELLFRIRLNLFTQTRLKLGHDVSFVAFAGHAVGRAAVTGMPGAAPP